MWSDEKLAPLDPIHRLVFLGLISLADDAGRLVDSVRQIDGLLFPETEHTCGPSLDALADLGLILRYTSDSGQRLIQIVGWEKHQKVDRPSAHVLPAPPRRTRASSNGAPKPSRKPREPVARESRDPISPTLDLGPRTLDLGPEGQDQPRRVSDVDNSGSGQEPPPPAAPAQPPELPAYAQKPAYTRAELLEEAKAECGLGTWSTPDVTSAQSVLTTWYGAGETPERIHAAIVGARQLVDRGEVDWLKARKPYGLKALNNTCAVVPMGDGRTQRLLYEAAVETYYRALDSPAARGKRGKGGPTRAGELLATTAKNGVSE